MQVIKAPMEPGQLGPDIANLQDALALFLSRGVIKAAEPGNIPSPEELGELSSKLTEERKASLFGEATQRLVQIVQIQQGLGDNLDGAVEKKTATLTSRLLDKLGALDGDEDPLYSVH